jgi:hypothetical protein
MTQPEPNQPQLQVGLRNQGSVLHQLYDLVLTTTKIEKSSKIMGNPCSGGRKRDSVETKKKGVNPRKNGIL